MLHFLKKGLYALATPASKLLLLLLALSFNNAHTQDLQRGFAWKFTIVNLDPHRLSSDTLLSISKHFIETLLIVDEDNKIQPGIAKSWAYDEKKQHLTFSLRKDAIWTDGTPINAHTVELSLLRALSDIATSDALPLISFLKTDNTLTDQPSPPGSNPNIQVIDDYTISLKVPSANPAYLRAFAHAITAPLPIHQLNKDNLFPEDITLQSSGPYRLLPREDNRLLTFQANEHYFGSSPFYKNVTFEFDEYKVLIEKYLKQELDILEYIIPTQKEWLQIHRSKEFISRAAGGVYLLFDHNAADVFSKEIRTALFGVLDQKTLFKIYKIKERDFPSGLLYFGSEDDNKEPLINTKQLLSKESAIKILKNAGYNATDNRLKICISQLHIKYVELLNYIDSQWSDLDIDVEIVDSSEQHFSSRHWFKGQGKTCSVALFGYGARLNSEEEVIMNLLEYSFDKNAPSFEQNKEIHQILQRLKTTQNTNDRLEIINEIEKLLLDEKLVLLVGEVNNNSLVKNHVKNYIKATRRNFIAYSQYLQ